MTEILAALVGVLATAAVGFFIYLYKSTVTYEIVSLSQRFVVEDDEIVLSSSWQGFDLCFERLVFRNSGRADVENFIAHVDRTPALLGYEISSTDTLSKEMISVETVGESLEVSVPRLPRGEKIAIEIVYKGPGGGREYRDAKGGGGKYRIKKKRHFDSDNRASMTILNILLLGFVVYLIASGK